MTERPYRVRRGGSWSRGPQWVRAVIRNYNSPKLRGKRIGVRLVGVVDDPAPASDAAGSNRVIRGGGWDFVPRYARAAIRVDDAPGSRFYDLGIRLVEVADE